MKEEGKESSKETSREEISSDDSERVTNEIKRKYQLQLGRDDSLDVKSGVILGFIALILVQIILSGQITAALSRNVSLLLPYASNTQYWVNMTALVTFSSAFLCLIFAAIIGTRAISIRPYKDADIDELFERYYPEHEIDAATFDMSIALRLQDARKKNKASSDKKAARTKNALRLLSGGVALLIVHFFVIVISTVVLP